MSSVHHVHAALNKLLNDAERTGLVTRNVARLASAPSLTTARAGAPEMTVWTPDELSRFLESIDGNRNAAMFRLLARPACDVASSSPSAGPTSTWRGAR